MKLAWILTGLAALALCVRLLYDDWRINRLIQQFDDRLLLFEAARALTEEEWADRAP